MFKIFQFHTKHEQLLRGTAPSSVDIDVWARSQQQVGLLCSGSQKSTHTALAEAAFHVPCPVHLAVPPWRSTFKSYCSRLSLKISSGDLQYNMFLHYCSFPDQHQGSRCGTLPRGCWCSPAGPCCPGWRWCSAPRTARPAPAAAPPPPGRCCSPRTRRSSR